MTFETAPAYIGGAALFCSFGAVCICKTNSAMDTGMPCYKMDARPRGLVLIIEIEEYVNDVQERRIGSEVSICCFRSRLKRS